MFIIMLIRCLAFHNVIFYEQMANMLNTMRKNYTIYLFSNYLVEDFERQEGSSNIQLLIILPSWNKILNQDLNYMHKF